METRNCDSCGYVADYIWMRSDDDPSGVLGPGERVTWQCEECGPPAMFDEEGESMYSARPLGGRWEEDPQLGFTSWSEYFDAGKWETADGWTIFHLGSVVG